MTGSEKKNHMLPRGLSVLYPKIQNLLKNVFMYHLIGYILPVKGF